MKEDFIPYDIAVKLKEKGFPQHICDDAYITENEYDDDKYLVGERWDIRFLPDYCIEVSAPTISQVLKWLREKKGLYVDISLYKKGYCTLIYETNFPDDKDYANSWRVNNTYNTYEEAAIAGIEYVVDNLI